MTYREREGHRGRDSLERDHRERHSSERERRERYSLERDHREGHQERERETKKSKIESHREKERDRHHDQKYHESRDSRAREGERHREKEDRRERESKETQRYSESKDDRRERESKEPQRYSENKDDRRERESKDTLRYSEGKDDRRERESKETSRYSESKGVLDRDGSVERRSHKRKDNGGEERLEKNDKRRRFEDRVVEESKGSESKHIELEKKEDRKVRKEKRRFEDQVDEESGVSAIKSEKKDEKMERKERGKKESVKDEVEDETRVVGSLDRGNGQHEHASKVQSDEPILGGDMNDKVQSLATSNGVGSLNNGPTWEAPSSVASRAVHASASSGSPLATKVSLISTPPDDKGLSVTRSHEAPGKSSTDGTTTAAGKSSLSIDALAKAKKALQIQKELSEKLKKLPQLSKPTVSSPTGTTQATQAAPSMTKTPTLTTPSPSTMGTSALPVTTIPSVNPASTSMAGISGLTNIPNYEAVKRAQELAAKLGFHQDPEFAPLINMFPGQAADVSAPQRPAKAPVLRLDALGREIDEHGNVINMPKPTNLSTLKVNINKQKKEAFQILRPDLDADGENNPYFDETMGINKTKLLRPKRMSFQFVEEGKWSKQAEIIKFKSQFGEAQAKELRTKQAQLAKAKAELDINPNLIEVSERIPIKEEKPKDPIPDIEWWDAVLLPSGSYSDVTGDKFNIRMDKITCYVEHPLPIEPPAEPAPPPPQPLKLTKKEQKKLRTQRRLAREKERQEMIRQGLIEPPKPKIKMSNLMKVLGSEATQDPTKLEMEIRSAAAEREQAHVDRNIARKLTPVERREKKERKLFDDPNTFETIVSVYKMNDLSHKQTRFKVDINAQENRLTGCAVIFDGFSVVVVEGGSKSIKRYGKLMLRRINWAAAVSNEEEGDDKEDAPVNKCLLVWQGSVAKPSFNRFFFHECRTEAAARKVFADAGVAHYWDLAANFTEEDI
ncbi:protein RDM16 isoform X1 [Amborella trichopoda]|uniref:protein RDM16 isoform X1 n=1 Tax=Amborella trichopoda TaxID=13333 RepID=UPI0005D4101A|nr:protein RDM16 isoform X1 [Amborella trichopoda]|eukprot:XP_011623805.1 protein RDM16 isoform X1 [Amborella trichopoda]